MSRMTLRDSVRVHYFLGRNPLSLAGVVLTTSSALTLIAFWVYDFLIPSSPHPYIGILLFLILPAIFLIGLLLIPVGVWLRRRALRAAGELPAEFPSVDLALPAVRNTLVFLLLATGANVLIFSFASYKGVAYMDTTGFCGQACHQVMGPEFSAYQGAPHSRVECATCHIGPGAGWFVKSKISGLRQVWALTTHTYSRPIPTPVKYLRPARDICEQCHWSQRNLGDKVLLRTSYKDNEKNTPLYTAIVLKVGNPATLPASGIHGVHLQPGATIRYIAEDAQRQTIPAVFYTDATGKTVEYLSSDTKLTPEQIARAEKREMDCLDCHNRPAHAFEMPEKAVDDRISRGTISADLPYIRKKAVELLKVDYPDRDAAAKQIADGITSYYRTSYPEIYQSKRALVEQAAAGVSGIYLRNVFPEMKVTWGVHPNNLGHNDFPGCFRCHDGSHTSADGQTIPNDCGACHNLTLVEEESPKLLSDLGLR